MSSSGARRRWGRQATGWICCRADAGGLWGCEGADAGVIENFVDEPATFEMPIKPIDIRKHNVYECGDDKIVRRR